MKRFRRVLEHIDELGVDALILQKVTEKYKPETVFFNVHFAKSTNKSLLKTTHSTNLVCGMKLHDLESIWNVLDDGDVVISHVEQWDVVVDVFNVHQNLGVFLGERAAA